jgi:hypothetical protein
MDMIGEDRAIRSAVHLMRKREPRHLQGNDQGETMTYNRMEAKPIAGEHCRFCGDAKAPLVKTPCCHQWICGDTAFFSFRGGGRCQVEHERFSMCYSHYEDKHDGPWESCQKCREFWSPRDYQRYAENPINWPQY